MVDFIDVFAKCFIAGYTTLEICTATVASSKEAKEFKGTLLHF
jgi:hypothetical protein